MDSSAFGSAAIHRRFFSGRRRDAEIWTVRAEGGDESPHSKKAVRCRFCGSIA
jgi:hypothetical protein